MLLDDSNDDKVQIPHPGIPDLPSSNLSPTHSPPPSIIQFQHLYRSQTGLHSLGIASQAVSFICSPLFPASAPEYPNLSHWWRNNCVHLPCVIFPDSLRRSDLLSSLSHETSFQLCMHVITSSLVPLLSEQMTVSSDHLGFLHVILFCTGFTLELNTWYLPLGAEEVLLLLCCRKNSV